MIIGKVSAAADPRIAVYRGLKDRHLHRDNAFIVEGKFILETLLTRSKFKVSSILIAEDRLSPLEYLLLHVPANVPVYISTPDVLAEIAGFNVHRGILAAGISAQPAVSLPTYLRQKSKIAVLSNISNPDNIGSIFRNAAGLGIDAIVLDRQCCSPLYRKAIRVSMGATLVLPWQQGGTIEEIVENLKREAFSIYALSLQSAKNLDEVYFEKRSAFIFGEEAYGLPGFIQAQSQAVTIPMAGGTDSLNVAATSAIVFAAARRQKT
jgi:tRNA G18 (ribose-2'-O)-methylase SpoU